MRQFTYNFFDVTALEWITGVTFHTAAYSSMLVHLAYCVQAARPLAWVAASLVYTRLCARTVRVHCTLSSAVWRSADKVIYASTRWNLIYRLT